MEINLGYVALGGSVGLAWSFWLGVPALGCCGRLPLAVRPAEGGGSDKGYGDEDDPDGDVLDAIIPHRRSELGASADDETNTS